MRLKHTYIFSWEFLNSWYRTAMLGKFYKDYTALTFEAKVLVKKVKMEMKIELKKKGNSFLLLKNAPGFRHNGPAMM